MLLVQFSAEKEAKKAADFPPPIILRPVLQHSVIIYSEEGTLLQHSMRWLLSVSSCQSEASMMNFEWTGERVQTFSNLKQKSRTGSGLVIV